MKNVLLITPQVNDLWFREKCMADEETMSYNAGYDVNIDGYHYDTGCIDFPKEKWQSWYDVKMKNPNFYYAYIQDRDNGEFVGHVNFNLNNKTKKASIGIVINSHYKGQGYMRPAMIALIEKAKEKNVKFLTDTVPDTRKIALQVFFDLGFKKVDEFKMKKFDTEENVLCLEKEL